MATSRLSFVSRARYTSPIPPLPRRAVISSEPSRVPTTTDIGISMEMQIALRGLCREATNEANSKEASTQVMWTRTVSMWSQYSCRFTCLVNRVTIDWYLEPWYEFAFTV